MNQNHKSPKHILSFLSILHHTKNPSLSLAYLLNLQDQTLNIPKFYQKSFFYHINSLKSNPHKFSKFFDLHFTFKEKEIKKYDLYENIKNVVNLNLIKLSFREYENFLNSFFGLKRKVEFGWVDDALKKIESFRCERERVVGYYYFINCIAKEDFTSSSNNILHDNCSSNNCSSNNMLPDNNMLPNNILPDNMLPDNMLANNSEIQNNGTNNNVEHKNESILNDNPVPVQHSDTQKEIDSSPQCISHNNEQFVNTNNIDSNNTTYEINNISDNNSIINNNISHNNGSINNILDTNTTNKNINSNNNSNNVISGGSKYNDQFIKKTLQFFIKSRTQSQTFFYILYLHNKNLYDSFITTIFSDYFYMRIDILKSLPLYDINLKEKELNESILKYLIENRPIFRDKITEYLIDRRDLLLNFLREYYSYFDIKKLNLSFEEHIVLCQSVDLNIYFLFEYLKFFIDGDSSFIVKFLKVLMQKDDSFLVLFFDNFYGDNPIYEEVVLLFLKSKRLSEELQKFFIEYFIDNIKIKKFNGNDHISNPISNRISNDNATVSNHLSNHMCNNISNHISNDNVIVINHLSNQVNNNHIGNDDPIVNNQLRNQTNGLEQTNGPKQISNNQISNNQTNSNQKNSNQISNNTNEYQISNQLNNGTNKEQVQIIEGYKKVDGFSEQFVKKVFFSLITYLNKEKLIFNLEKYLKDESSLREFLKVLSPDDIYYNIHYFKEIQNSIVASQMITQKKEIFNDQVSMRIIKSMEESALPPLFMRTVILSVINFPSLRKFVVELMLRLVKMEIWTIPRLYDGFIKCLSFLSHSCIEVIMTMPEERMNEVFEKNKKVLKMCEAYLKTHSGLKGRYAFFFKNAVITQLKRMRS